MEPELAQQYQRMITLWFALLMSVGLYFLLTVWAAPKISDVSANPSDRFVIIGLTALGAFLVIVSLAVKRKLLNRSAEKQDVGLVQKAMVLACAMCEVAALLGLLERFVLNSRDYYWLFLIAVTGMVLHFPRRSHLEAASWRPPQGSSLQI